LAASIFVIHEQNKSRFPVQRLIIPAVITIAVMTSSTSGIMQTAGVTGTTALPAVIDARAALVVGYTGM